MLLGSIGLRAKDFFFAANLAYFLMLLFCGVNIPLYVLPGWMSGGRPLPAADARDRRRARGRRRRVARATSPGSSGRRPAIAVAYAAAGFGLFRVLERESRRSAVLDAY